jgi:hypothetical protein
MLKVQRIDEINENVESNLTGFRNLSGLVVNFITYTFLINENVESNLTGFRNLSGLVVNFITYTPNVGWIGTKWKPKKNCGWSVYSR